MADYINTSDWQGDESYQQPAEEEQAQNPDQVTSVNDLPVIMPLTPPAGAPAYRNNLAMQTAMVKSATTGEDPSAAYSIAATADNPLEESKKAAIAKAQQELDDVDGFIKNQFEANPAALPQLAQDHQELTNDIQQEYAGPLGKEKVVVNSVSDPEIPFNIADTLKQQTTVNLAVANDVQQLMNDAGISGKYIKGLFFSEFLLGGIPGERVTTNLLEEGGEGKVTFTSPEQIQEFVLRWHSLPPERKMEVYPAFKAQVLKAAYGDPYEAAKWLMNLLDPTQGADIKHELYTQRFFLGLQAVGGLGMMSKIATGIANVADSSTTAVKLAGSVGNSKLAGNISSAVVLDQTGKMAEATKVTKAEAAQMGLPLDLSAYDTSHVSGLAPSIQNNITAYTRQLAQTQDVMTSQKGRVAEGILSPEEAAGAAQKQLDGFINETLDAYNNTGIKATNAQYTNLSDKGATLEVTVNLPEGNQTFTKNVIFTRNDITGTYDWKEISTNPFVKNFLSPSYKYRNVAQADIAAYTRASFETKAVTETLKTTFEQTGYFKLPAASKGKLDEVLLAGDEYIDPMTGSVGKTFTPEELLGGIDTPSGKVQLSTEGELTTYYNTRNYIRMLGKVDNQITRRQLELEGYKSAWLTDDAPTLIKPMDKAVAKAQLTKGDVKRVYDDSTQSVIDGSTLSSKIDDLYAQGYRLTKVENDDLKLPNLAGDENIRYAFIKDTTIKELPEHVLQLKEGYIPRLYKGQYFVKRQVKQKVNGDEITKLVAHRQFYSKKDADAYAKQLNTDNVIGGKPADEFKVVGDREQTFEQSIGELKGTKGGLVFGTRASEQPLMGAEGMRPDRVSAIESIDRNINLVSSQISRNELRVKLQKKFLNTVQQAGVRAESFYDVKLPTMTKEGQKLQDLYKTIENWVGVPSKEERLWEATFQSLHDWALEGARVLSPSKNTIQSLLYLKHKDPVALIRASVFHAYLGMFNLAGVFVQGSQAIIPFSRSPINGTKALSMYPILSALEHVDDANLPAMLAKMNKIKGFKQLGLDKNTDTLVEMLQGWKQSGFKYAAKLSDNYDLIANGVGMSKKFAGQVLDAGMVPYNTGVNFGNKIAYMTNFLEWKAANTGKKLNPEALKTIISNTDRDLFHMTQVNRAEINQGVWSVPFQFTNIMFRSVEALLGNEFTIAQKFRIFGAQVALYGSAATGMKGIVDYIYRSNGVEPGQLEGTSKEAYTAMSQGILGWAFLKATGMDLNISGRVAVLSGINQTVQNILFDERPLWSTALGAFGGIADRSFQLMGKLKPLALASYEEGKVSKATLILAAQEIAKLPSSTRNFMQAITMHNLDMIADKNGLPIISRDFSLSEEVAQAIGFQSNEVGAAYEINTYNNKRTQNIQAIANTYVYTMWNYTEQFENPQDPALEENLNALWTVTMQGLDPMMKADVLTAIRNKIANPQSKYEKGLSTFLKNAFPGMLYDALLQTKQDVENNPHIKIIKGDENAQ